MCPLKTPVCPSKTSPCVLAPRTHVFQQLSRAPEVHHKETKEERPLEARDLSQLRNVFPSRSCPTVYCPLNTPASTAAASLRSHTPWHWRSRRGGGRVHPGQWTQPAPQECGRMHPVLCPQRPGLAAVSRRANEWTHVTREILETRLRGCPGIGPFDGTGVHTMFKRTCFFLFLLLFLWSSFCLFTVFLRTGAHFFPLVVPLTGQWHCQSNGEWGHASVSS